ncbi:MAG: hypothetical protein AB4206_19415 [Xenococcaceae cyanobacterium]
MTKFENLSWAKKTTILSGLLIPVFLVGGLGAILIQITDKKNENDNSTEAGKKM